jgi:hypothetical protein
MLLMRNHSEHFINYIIHGKNFDFNDFRTREEFDNYKKELNEFSNMNETEKEEVIFKLINK